MKDMKDDKKPKREESNVAEIEASPPTLIKLSEFINLPSVRNGYKVETLGGFLHWVIGRASSKLSYKGWKELLDKFVNRIV